jgi:hypothetical protein
MSLQNVDDCRAVIIANHSGQAVYDVSWSLWDLESESWMDKGFVRSLAPSTEWRINIPGPFGGDSKVYFHFVDANGVLWGRTEYLLSASEWFEHPDRNLWIDPSRKWSAVWPESEVNAIRELLGIPPTDEG